MSAVRTGVVSVGEMAGGLVTSHGVGDDMGVGWLQPHALPWASLARIIWIAHRLRPHVHGKTHSDWLNDLMMTTDDEASIRQ
jgi:hypothetical protein